MTGHQKGRQVEEVFEDTVTSGRLRQISVPRGAARAHFGANHAVHHQSVPLPPNLKIIIIINRIKRERPDEVS